MNRSKPAMFKFDNRGVAAVEFALMLPLLLSLGLGGLELVHYLIVQMQVNRIAVMTADNASRLPTQMSESFINQLFVGANKAGADIDFKHNGRIVLSSVQTSPNGPSQWIRWQRCFGSLPFSSRFGGEDTGSDGWSLPNVNGLVAEPGSAFMYVEVKYKYQPIIPGGLFQDREMTREAAFIVRQRTDYSIAGSSPALCT